MTVQTTTSPPSTAAAGGIAAVLYGVAAYALFLGTFLYAIAFVGNLPCRRRSTAAQPGRSALALTVNTLLLGLFAIQHSVMARPAFKRWWTRFVPQSVERTTYVLLTSLVLVLLYWQWRPMTGVDLVGDQSRGRRDPAGDLLDRLGDRADQHVPDQSLRAVRPAPGFCPAAQSVRCRSRCSGRRCSTRRRGIRSISASCSPSGRRRR